MFTRLDAILFVACFASGALALENHGRIDIAGADKDLVTSVACQPKLRPASLRPPLVLIVDFAPDIWVEPAPATDACNLR